MEKTVAIVRREDGENLNVLGAGVRFLCTAEQTGHAWSLMETALPLNAGPPPHHHMWDEAYYVISGAVAFEIAGQKSLIEAGEFVYAPGGTVHGFRGASEEPARMLVFDAPAHAEAFFKTMDRRVRRMPEDLSLVPAIGHEHGIEFLPMA